jgi:hypothetical protein
MLSEHSLEGVKIEGVSRAIDSAVLIFRNQALGSYENGGGIPRSLTFTAL